MMLMATALLALSLHGSPDTALTTTDVTFTTSDGQRLGGEVFRPAHATGELPGLLLVHGSGQGNSWRELKAEAEAFARQGMVVLAPDKRSAGYSKTHRDYGQLADDALKAFAVLERQPAVGHAGIWGLSEGGWVAPIAASRAKDVEFLVTVGGPGLSPLRTQSWNATNKVDRSGVQGSLRTAYARTFHRLAGDAGLFPEAYYDPGRTLASLTQPVLALWGAQDNQVMPAESAQRFLSGVRTSLTVRFFPGAPHALHTGPDTLTPGYAETVGSWVRRVAAGDVPASSAQPLPVQPTRSVDTPPSAWWESWQLQLGAMVAMLLAFLWYGVRRRSPGSWPARVLAVCGALSIAGLVYTMLTLLLSSNGAGVSTGPLLFHRPIVWLAAQLLAAATALAALTCLAKWRTASARVRVAAVAGAAFIPWALYWGLLVP